MFKKILIFEIIKILCSVLFLNKNIESRPELQGLAPPPPQSAPSSQYPSIPLIASGYDYDQPLNPLNEYGPPTAQPIIEKHVYVHVPPTENHPARVPKPVPVRIPKKHYKVVFIKVYIDTEIIFRTAAIL